MWKWTAWMVFSSLLVVVFGVVTYRNIGEIREAESAEAVIAESPVVSPAGEGEIVTARVRFATHGGATVDTFVIGVPADAAQGDMVTVHFVASKPHTAVVGEPPNRTLGLVLSSLFTLIGIGGLWSFGHDRPRPEYDS